MSTRHKRTPKGRFVLRADSIRPYSLGGEAVPFNAPLCPVRFRADAIRPYRVFPA